MEKDISEEIINLSGSLQPANKSLIRDRLIVLVNTLINKDFHSLIQLLYQIDISENKIRSCLQNDSEILTADIIADLIIERQLQKIESRKIFSSKNEKLSNEEIW
ncbi:hypothetical protein [Hanamia caeni]|nr:hypothetical protein [Hanamia caeni]